MLVAPAVHKLFGVDPTSFYAPSVHTGLPGRRKRRKSVIYAFLRSLEHISTNALYFQQLTAQASPFLSPYNAFLSFCVILSRTGRAGVMSAGCRFFRLDLAGGGEYNCGISIPYFYPSGDREASGRFFYELAGCQ